MKFLGKTCEATHLKGAIQKAFTSVTMPKIWNTCIEGVILALIITFEGNFVHNIELPASACKESISTVQSVYACPMNKKEHDAASTRKSCQNIPNMCKSIEYHCVINEWLNGTVEVCATRIYIHARTCAVFIAELQSIRASFSTNCKTCPHVYNSSETYKYPECYDEVRGSLTSVHPSTTTTTERTLYLNTTPHLNGTHTPTERGDIYPVDDDNSKTTVVYVVVAVLLILTCICLVTGYIWRRRRYSRTKRSTEELSLKAPRTSEMEHLTTEGEGTLQEEKPL
ncbi:uncharacterized protein LOC125656040 [Ostrea edulis]|uniref:uncharacterized protein LOC125656040 n=1 Tax=Ostrea edulis TaxID=37623 RepID=UPI0024AF9771|nr:uncharacterized protein LOC125656040 [Ostrea edulis]